MKHIHIGSNARLRAGIVGAALIVALSTLAHAAGRIQTLGAICRRCTLGQKTWVKKLHLSQAGGRLPRC